MEKDCTRKRGALLSVLTMMISFLQAFFPTHDDLGCLRLASTRISATRFHRSLALKFPVKANGDISSDGRHLRRQEKYFLCLKAFSSLTASATFELTFRTSRSLLYNKTTLKKLYDESQ